MSPELLDELSNKVKIRDMYPYDTFEYILIYDGRGFPMQKAPAKMQVDFEDECEDRLNENQHSKDLHELDRKSRGLGRLSATSTTLKRGSAAQ